MEMTGEQIIPAAQARVWRGLNDPEVLKACISGCESIERLSDTEYTVVTVAAIGPVKAKFRGKLLLADLDPPHSYSLSFDGQGGAAGFGKGSAKVSLAAAGASTHHSGASPGAASAEGSAAAAAGPAIFRLKAAKKSSAIFFATPSIRREPICASLPPPAPSPHS